MEREIQEIKEGKRKVASGPYGFVDPSRPGNGDQPRRIPADRRHQTTIYYAPTTLTNVGYGNAAAIYANLIMGVVNVLMIPGDNTPHRPGRAQAAASNRLVGIVLS